MHVSAMLTCFAAAAAAAALQEDYQAEPEEESEVRTPGQLLRASIWPQLPALRGLTCLLCTTGCQLPGVLGSSHALQMLQVLGSGCPCADICGYLLLILLCRVMMRMMRERRRCACIWQAEQEAAC
jgi:hypothetical protein